MMAQSSRQVDIDQIVAPLTPVRRIPYHCSRARPCRTVKPVADALQSAAMEVAEEVAAAAVERAFDPAADPYSFVEEGVAPCTLAFAGSRSVLEASSSSSAEAGMENNMAAGRNWEEAGRMAHVSPAPVCRKAACRPAVAVVSIDIVAAAKSMVVEVAEGMTSDRSRVRAVDFGRAAARLVLAEA